MSAPASVIVALFNEERGSLDMLEERYQLKIELKVSEGEQLLEEPFEIVGGRLAPPEQRRGRTEGRGAGRTRRQRSGRGEGAKEKERRQDNDEPLMTPARRKGRIPLERLHSQPKSS